MGKEVRQEFDSMWSWLKFLQTPTDMKDSQRESLAPSFKQRGTWWHGSKTWDEAIGLALNGWEDGIKRIEKMSARLDENLVKILHVPEVTHDVTGDQLDVGRFIAGEPEDFMSLTPAEVEQEPKILNMAVNVGASAVVDTEVMIKKGAAVVALIDALQRHGKRVVVDAFTTAVGGYLFRKGTSITTRIRIKDSDAPIQYANLVFALAHPSTHRRLAFCSWEHCDAKTREAVGITKNGGYGRPMDISTEEQEEYDIHIGSRYGSWSEEDSMRFVISQLSEQGIYAEKGVE